MVVGQFRHHAAAGCSLDEAFHDEERLVGFLDRVGFLPDGHGDRRKADGAAAEFDADGFEDPPVHVVKPVGVDFE